MFWVLAGFLAVGTSLVAGFLKSSAVPALPVVCGERGFCGVGSQFLFTHGALTFLTDSLIQHLGCGTRTHCLAA